ncbi:RNA polymerase subunit sigma-24 [Thermaurantimonas aggregans]|uniref:RNA polymerase subunit sigma-24 n=1 Tax=Thermaurantimonas aggregans TaxID=2173829 RepID=A0A401XKS7_9FLAO|nr:sigma-70 family RNA polymerase sigma factor [Thermaurantimonas aggregans]MCX8147928.1 sigma-70 family RNA polymerase sigma factor [Thermaurantimonas aggregans]GCD77590.1 RNA polymerase subunit sigma-24 [Thermaurantimonas aggregans]
MAYHNLTDQQLIELYLSGNEGAFAHLLSRHQKKVYQYILSKVKDDDLADDIFQDVFIKVINTLKLGRYNEEGKFINWVLRISHNYIIDHFRKTSKTNFVTETADQKSIFTRIKATVPSWESQVICEQTEADLKKLISMLPPDQRQVLEMRIYEDLSFKEIAELTTVSINTALGRMRYALINLRKLIKKHKVKIELPVSE